MTDQAAPRTKWLSRRRFLALGALGFGITSSAAGYARLVEPDHLDVTHTKIPLKNWRFNRPILAGLLSDFHCISEASLSRTKRAVSALRSRSPDIVFLTGDFLTRDPSKWAARCANVVEPLASIKYGTYAILGNHDWWSGGPELLTTELDRVGIRVLRNRSVLTECGNLWITGLDDVLDGRSDANKATKGLPTDSARILLVHEPDFADDSPPGFSLQLSGHSHGGQICLPGGKPLSLPVMGRRYPRGLMQSPNHLVYTTRGIGMVFTQCRLFSPPELTMLRLVPERML